MGSHMRWHGWLIVAAAAVSGCASVNGNKLSNTQKIKAGMSTGEVTTLLGKPPWTFDPATVQEWRYCSTDRPSDVIVAVFFRNDVVVERTSYRVDLSDLHFGETTGGRIGSCLDTINGEGPGLPRKIRDRAYGR
jgi:outer membrane protein assembly factor BamE (lipoprotein component of BamABCDE complex)